MNYIKTLKYNRRQNNLKKKKRLKTEIHETDWSSYKCKLDAVILVTGSKNRGL